MTLSIPRQSKIFTTSLQPSSNLLLAISMDQQIKRIIADVLNVDAAIVTEDLATGSIPEWDSVGNLAIISTIEQELGIEFPLEELFDLNSVKTIIDAVNRLKNA